MEYRLRAPTHAHRAERLGTVTPRTYIVQYVFSGEVQNLTISVIWDAKHTVINISDGTASPSLE
jgi:hypothetical protein